MIENGVTYKKGQQGKFLFKNYIVTIRHGEKLEYECNKDYVLKGSPGKTCVDGTWRPQQDSECEPSKHMKLLKYWKPIEETGP